MRASLFLILPEYQDPVNPTHQILASTNLLSERQLTAYLAKLSAAVYYLKDEDVTIYYDVKNLAAFLYPVRLMPDIYPNKRLYQLALIEKRMQSWNNQSEQQATDRFVYRNQQTEDNTLCEIARRQYNNQLARCVYAVMNHGALNHRLGNRERVVVECNGKSKTFWVIKADVGILLNWLKEKGVIKRIYRPNTAKHGTAGRGGLQANNVSPLLCQNREAKKMMKKAFRYGKHLYYFDVENQKYIRFMSGNNDTYHPYHIISKQDEHKYIKPAVKEVLRYYFGEINVVY